MGNSVTIADVANHLGVSKSTVSHALSGKRRISSAVKRQVLEAVRELGYRPNFAARVMNTHRTGLVGVVVDSLNNPHTTALLEELGRELARYSMQMVLCSAGEVENGRLLLSKFSNGMVDGILTLIPSAKVGHIGLYRDEETAKPIEYFCKLPCDISEREVIVVDPMLATGGSAIDAVSMIKKHGAANIKFMCIIAAPEGLAAFGKVHPDVKVYVGALDEKLNDRNYIVPGLGDAGDRIFGTK